MNKKMNQESVEKIKEITKSQLHNSIWIWVSKDSSDRLFDTFISNNHSSLTYALISEKTQKLIVSTLDENANSGIDKLIYSDPKDIAHLLTEHFISENWPHTIYLNFSKLADPKVDSLGHGQFVELTSLISEIYLSHEKPQPQYESADEFLYSLIEYRSPKQITRMKLAAKRAASILKESFSKIVPGMSEKEIFSLIQSTVVETREEFCKSNNIESEAYAWNKDMCPIVLVGPNLEKNGHTPSSEYQIREGETIYADFGVKLSFADGGVVCSDLQRMAYLPKKGEPEVPVDVQRVFETLTSSIKLGMEKIRPGMFGYEIDEIVRDNITTSGFPDYDHATGHPIGEVAHSAGALIGTKKNLMSKRRIQLGGTYTFEPRCQIKNGGSIEEMILVTENGGIPLSKPQTELWII